MSFPILACAMYKAAEGDKDMYNAVLKAMRLNKRCGHYTVFPCQCNPPCKPPSQEQYDNFQKQLEEDTADIQLEPYDD